jgi:hypothetical protein
MVEELKICDNRDADESEEAGRRLKNIKFFVIFFCHRSLLVIFIWEHLAPEFLVTEK